MIIIPIAIIARPTRDKCLLGIMEIWLSVFLSLSGIIAKKNPSNTTTEPIANSTFCITLSRFPLCSQKTQS